MTMLQRARYFLILGTFMLLGLVWVQTSRAQGPTPGQNVNMVSGSTWPYGDPFLERQNEPSLAVSTRNALHLLAGANDYRTVDLGTLFETEPGEVNTCPFPCPPTAEPWVGQYISIDGGAHWQSTLLPGFPQDGSPQGTASPLHGFTTASDPVVRAGTNGLFYYAGIAFNRGTNNGVIYVARFMDLNNKENGNVASDSFPIRYINTGIVARGSATQFLDKPWIAVDIPRSGRTCNLSVPQGSGHVAQTIPAGNVYVAYANIATVNGITTSTIYFSRSLDCGQTWSTPIALSQGYALSQGVTIQIDPQTGIVYVCWRTFHSGTTQPNDRIAVAVSLTGGTSFTPGFPIVTLPAFNINTPNAPAFFDQGTTPVSFRSAAYPAMAVEDSGFKFVPGPVFFAWSQRGVGPNGAARIMMLAIPGNLMISLSGITLPTPFPVDNGAITDEFNIPLKDNNGNVLTQGHQWGPSMTYIEGKLMLVYYDQRLDHTLGNDAPSVSNGFFVPDTEGKFYEESRQLEGELTANRSGDVFNAFISDANPPLNLRRHTIDLTLAQSNGGFRVPTFTFTRVSQYDFGLFFDDDEQDFTFHQLKVNPPDLPMFEQGQVPFMGDYIDIVGQMFVLTPNGWAFNNPGVNSSSPVHYAAWTSNQDVIPPADGKSWNIYTAIPLPSQTKSKLNGQDLPSCAAGYEGDRNQNVYQSRITQGLLVSSPQNSKPLLDANGEPIQRAFIILVQNSTNFQKVFRATIANQPPGNFAVAGQATVGGYASFQQALPNQPTLPNPLPVPVTTRDVTIVAHSGAALTVFVLSSSATASVLVNIKEIQNGTILTGGLSAFILLNADGTVPTLTNPDSAPQNTNITGVEIYDPGISGPGISGANANAMSITSPGISGPGISGSTCGAPGISGPGISGSGCTSPGISGPGISGPGISGMTVVNPGISGSNVPAPGISGAAVSDVTYTVSNSGNTTAGYNVALVGCDTAPCSTTPLQLVLSQIYVTPGTDGQCNLISAQQDITLSNNAHPVFTPANQLGNPGISGAAVSDASFSLGPGDTAYLTVRGFVNEPTMETIATQLAPALIPQAIDTNSSATTPTIVTPLFITTSTLPDAVNGQPYAAASVLQAIGGTPPYTWTVTGNLPAGLTLDGSTGVISGAPDTSAGTYMFTVQVNDSSNPAKIAARALLIRIVDPLVVTTASPLASASQGQGYGPANFSATGGIAPYTWSFTDSKGTVITSIDGLNLTSGGVLSGSAGTPTNTGVFTFIATVMDSASPPQTTSSQITLNVVPFSPAGVGVLLFDNWNTAAVLTPDTQTPALTTPPDSTTFYLPSKAVLTQIANYHWNNGAGDAPGTDGTITITNLSTGQTFGPFPAAGVSGQGGASNAAWVASLTNSTGTTGMVVPAGVYKVSDSHSGTWSYNGTFSTITPAPGDTTSGHVVNCNCGFTRVWGSIVGPTFTATQAGPNQWTYTLTFAPLVNYSIFPVNTQSSNVTTITLTGLTGVTSASGATSTDFPAGVNNTANLNWQASVLNNGTEVVFTHTGPGTGNFPDVRHAFGFTINATGALNATVTLATSGFSRDTTNPLPDGTFNLDITDVTVGPVAQIQ
jgi:Putative Ig domain